VVGTGHRDDYGNKARGDWESFRILAMLWRYLILGIVKDTASSINTIKPSALVFWDTGEQWPSYAYASWVSSVGWRYCLVRVTNGYREFPGTC